MTTITSKDLKELSAIALEGDWISQDGFASKGPGEPAIADFRMHKRNSHINADFACAASNAYRSGLLVHVDDIDEQELLDEMRAERDEAREEVEKLRAHVSMMKEALHLAMTNHKSSDDSPFAGYIEDYDGSIYDAMILAHAGPSHAALSQGEDGA